MPRAGVRAAFALRVVLARVEFIDGPLCVHCGTPFDIDPGGDTTCGPCLMKPHDFDIARSVLRYDDASKPLILRFKHSDRLDHAPTFGRWLERSGRALLAECELIVPVPLHRWRLWRRRYNQAAAVAEKLSRLAAARTIRCCCSANVRRQARARCPRPRRGGVTYWALSASLPKRKPGSRLQQFFLWTMCSRPEPHSMPAPAR